MPADQRVDTGASIRREAIVSDGGDEAMPGRIPCLCGRGKRKARGRPGGEQTEIAHDGFSSIACSRNSSDTRHDADAIDAGLAGFVENARDVLKIERGRAGNVNDAIGAAREDLFETFGKLVPGDWLSVDIEMAIGMNADDDFAWRRRLGAVGGR